MKPRKRTYRLGLRYRDGVMNVLYDDAIFDNEQDARAAAYRKAEDDTKPFHDIVVVEIIEIVSFRKEESVRIYRTEHD